MKKQLLLAIFLLISFTALAQETSPMNDWEFDSFVTLNGRTFLSVAQSYQEQDGYAVVSGEKLHYWLYDTISYHDGDSDDIYNKYIPRWIEGMGHVIDFDNIRVIDPNSGLASSVKALMRQRGCDISVALVSGNSVIINEHFKSRDIYKTTVYPFYTEVSEAMRYLGFTANTGAADLGAAAQTDIYQRAVADRDIIMKKAGARYGSGGLVIAISEMLAFVQTEFADKYHFQQGHLYKVWWQQRMDDKNAALVVYVWLSSNNTLTDATEEEILYCYLE